MMDDRIKLRFFSTLIPLAKISERRECGRIS
jgi:hypothetical protein